MIKTVLITGSSNGIGASTALVFAKNGWNVIITYHESKKEAESISKKCKSIGANEVLTLNLDVMDDKSIEKCVKQVIKKYKHIDALINNAGFLVEKSLVKQNQSEIEVQLRTNLEGLIKMTKSCLPYVKDSIINISSRLGKSVLSERTVYCATKWGVRGFTQALALEHPQLNIISVNPSLTATRMGHFKGHSPDKVAEIIFDAVNHKYNLQNGGDIDVGDILE